MARPLLLRSPIHNLQFSTIPMTTMTLFFGILSVLSVISVISFLCGTRKMKRRMKYVTETEEGTTRSKENKVISKLNSNLSSRALSMVKMLSWRKVQAQEEEEYEEGVDYSDQDEEVLWRKNILMGERCRPIDFSGKILCDSEGNFLPDLPHKNEYNQH
ncbi:hypothetical protein RIF29_17409 [Crotalaria pallida]|uniref:Transmembrane protein n=1 Tax=Crotalaria pallida TaxID=3830 RepID=A0AAN9FKG5_CROPI